MCIVGLEAPAGAEPLDVQDTEQTDGPSEKTHNVKPKNTHPSDSSIQDILSDLPKPDPTAKKSKSDLSIQLSSQSSESGGSPPVKVPSSPKIGTPSAKGPIPKTLPKYHIKLGGRHTSDESDETPSKSGIRTSDRVNLYKESEVGDGHKMNIKLVSGQHVNKQTDLSPEDNRTHVKVSQSLNSSELAISVGGSFTSILRYRFQANSMF